MKSIAVFNNKGGVGKTTLLCNLAACLSIKYRKKVLVIDADPQCNATQSMFSDDWLYKLYDKGGFTLSDVVKPLSAGKGYSDTITTHRSERFALDVLAGHPSMSLYEDLLASDWTGATAGKERGLRTTLLFAELLTKCESYDYVFFDVGPSLGSINRSVLLAADYFLSPLSIDIFSLKALDNISIQLRDWKKRFLRGLEDADKNIELGIPNPGWHLQFVGYVTQQYKPKTIRGKKQPVQAYEKIMRQIPEAIQSKLIDDLGCGPGPSQSLLGSIPLLHSLVPMSQTSRAPIFDLRSLDGVRGAHFARVQDFEKTISGIAKNFMHNISEMTDP